MEVLDKGKDPPEQLPLKASMGGVSSKRISELLSEGLPRNNVPSAQIGCPIAMRDNWLTWRLGRLDSEKKPFIMSPFQRRYPAAEIHFPYDLSAPGGQQTLALLQWNVGWPFWYGGRKAITQGGIKGGTIFHSGRLKRNVIREVFRMNTSITTCRVSPPVFRCRLWKEGPQWNS